MTVIKVDIRLANLDTGEIRVILDGDDDANDPVWMPDGVHLLVETLTSQMSEWHILKLNVNTGESVLLAPGYDPAPQPS